MALYREALCLVLILVPYTVRLHAQNAISLKVDSLLALMTLEEKIGQMVQVDHLAIKGHEQDIPGMLLGSILFGGSSDPEDNSPEQWLALCKKYQEYTLRSKLKIPLLIGIDAVHGHNNVDGAVIFPHNIGLGATRNPELVQKIGKATAEEMIATGFNWAFAPCVAVARNEKWGRTYESYGEDPEIVKDLGAAFIQGLQEVAPGEKSFVAACAKHFVGDGGTTNGKDRGNTECDIETLRKIHLPGYIAAIKAGVQTIMVSYSSWNDVKMHENRYLITDVLKGELGFQGIVISDWAAIDQLGENYKDDIQKAIHAGLDMVMIPHGPMEKNNYIEFIEMLKQAVQQKSISIDRLNDAVRRILTVKYAMQITSSSSSGYSLQSVGSDEHRKIAREAVRQSLVLLKNEKQIVPLSKNLKRIHVTGKCAADLGYQCGGWTISWQGRSGQTIVGGTTLLQAIKTNAGTGTQVTYSRCGENVEGADVCIAVIGEEPYAEMKGDREDLFISKEDDELLMKIDSAHVPLITLLYSGRPMIINEGLKHSKAFIAAWLPGSEGEGIADLLFGKYPFSGTLPCSWPKSMEQIPINKGDEIYEPLFPYGFGLRVEIQCDEKVHP